MDIDVDLTVAVATVVAVVRAALIAVGALLVVLFVRVVWVHRFQGRLIYGHGLDGVVAFALFTFIATVDQVARFGDPMTWRLPLYGVALAAALVSAGREMDVPLLSRLLRRDGGRRRGRGRRKGPEQDDRRGP